MNHYEILGVKISRVNPHSAAGQIAQWIQAKDKTYVCVAPVSTIVDCQKDEDYRRIINSAGMVTPDGMPVAWLGKWSGYKDVERTYGPELMLNVCEAGLSKGFRHFIYGGSEAGNRALIAKLQEKFPGIHIAGYYAPGFLSVRQKESADVIRKINDAKPDILWVGLGSSKQDHWMSIHRDELNVPVIVGVGAAFDFIAGIKPQAPKWMRESGLEWLFRLDCEPKRLWKRYLIGNTYFVWLLVWGGIKKIFYRRGRF